MVEAKTGNNLPQDFRQAASQTVAQRSIIIDVDADVLEWLEQQKLGSVSEDINGLLRFYMETSQIKEQEFAHTAWEPGELDSQPAEMAPAL